MKFMSFPRKCHPEYLKRINYLYAFLPRRRKYRFRMRNPRNSRIFMEIHGIHDFMENHGFHVKITRKQTFVPEAENDSKTYAFLHVWEAVRVLLVPEWWNSLNSTNFSRMPLILVKCSGKRCFQGFRGRELCLYTERYYTKCILGRLKCFSLPYH